MKVDLTQEVKEFISTFQDDTRIRINRSIVLLNHYGHLLRMPHSKNILPGVFELRIRGKQNVRLVYVFKDNAALIFYGFTKKSQEITTKELRNIVEKLRLHL